MRKLYKVVYPTKFLINSWGELKMSATNQYIDQIKEILDNKDNIKKVNALAPQVITSLDALLNKALAGLTGTDFDKEFKETIAKYNSVKSNIDPKDLEDLKTYIDEEIAKL